VVHPFRALAKKRNRQAGPNEYHESNKTRLSGAIGTSEWITESLQRPPIHHQSSTNRLACSRSVAPRRPSSAARTVTHYNALIAIGSPDRVR